MIYRFHIVGTIQAPTRHATSADTKTPLQWAGALNETLSSDLVLALWRGHFQAFEIVADADLTRQARVWLHILSKV